MDPEVLHQLEVAYGAAHARINLPGNGMDEHLGGSSEGFWDNAFPMIDHAIEEAERVLGQPGNTLDEDDQHRFRLVHIFTTGFMLGRAFEETEVLKLGKTGSLDFLCTHCTGKKKKEKK